MAMLYAMNVHLYPLSLFSIYPQEVVLETEFEEEKSKFTMKQVNFQYKFHVLASIFLDSFRQVSWKSISIDPNL